MSSNHSDGAASAPFSVVGRKPLARFAPSPTGPLHAGSLLAAVGSYLDARSAGARWLVRIEDLDTPRVIPGCAAQMLRTLEAFGFEWDGEVLYQSTRRDAYAQAIAALGDMHRTYRCSCSRRDLAGDAGEQSIGYPGTCRHGPTRPGATSIRFRVGDLPIHFDDLYLGPQTYPAAALGDFVIERRDGLATYQLAVVVDDAFQGITRVVRGADLLASTGWQIELQQALGFPRPIYGHLPLLLEPDGKKLSKSRHALPIDGNDPSVAKGGGTLDLPSAKGSGALDLPTGERSGTLDPPTVSEALTSTLTLLSQSPPADLGHYSIKDVWNWAFAHWNPQALVGTAEARLSASSDT